MCKNSPLSHGQAKIAHDNDYFSGLGLLILENVTSIVSVTVDGFSVHAIKIL